MGYTIQFKRGTSAQWTSQNPVLADGEPALETDTGKIKIGDGTTEWGDLSYLAGDGGGEPSVGVPAGGYAGQFLSKVDNTDYNTKWVDAPSGGGGGSGISVVSELPASPTDGQTCLYHNAVDASTYLCVYSTVKAKWYKTSMITAPNANVTIYTAAQLYDSLITGDATKSITTEDINGYTSAILIQGAAGSTKYLEFAFDAGAGGELTIRFAQNSEQGYDYGLMYIDGLQIYSGKGLNTTFNTVTVDLTLGSHIFKVAYLKDSSGDQGYDGFKIFEWGMVSYYQ